MLIACCVGCAASREHLAKGLPNGHAVRSHQVLLLTDQKIPQEEEILQELSQIRARLEETLDVPPGEREVVVYLFADRDRYAQYMRETHPNLPARRAFFIGTSKELAVFAHWGDHVMVDLRHEYTHGLLHSSIGRVPLWLDEGLAEYFEVGGDSPADINPEHLGPLVQAGLAGWQPDLKRLERLEEVNDMHREHYQEAWAWVHYLLHQAPGGRELLSQYLRELRRGGEEPPTLSARMAANLRGDETELVRYLAELDHATRILPAAFSAPQ